MGFYSWWKGERKSTKQDLIDSFLDMPFILKMITPVNLFLPAFPFIIFVNPNVKIEYNDESAPYDYLWESGMIFWSFISVTMMIPAAYMMLRRKNKLRKFNLFAWGI